MIINGIKERLRSSSVAAGGAGGAGLDIKY